MYLLIDIGGTLTRIAISKDLKQLEHVVKFPTQHTLKKQQFLINKTLNEMSVAQLDGGVIGVPAIVINNRIVVCANLPYLEKLLVEDLLDVRLHGPRLLGVNDAALAALGEAVAGAGKSYTSCAYITLSTGVGGAVIREKKLDLAQMFFEPGHHYIKDTKTFEDLCSATAFKKLYNCDPKTCKDENIWDLYAQDLAKGLSSVHAFWAPDVIVLGGRIGVHSFSNFVHLLHNHMEQDAFWHTVEQKGQILQSTLLDDNGLHGAMALLKQVL